MDDSLTRRRALVLCGTTLVGGLAGCGSGGGEETTAPGDGSPGGSGTTDAPGGTMPTGTDPSSGEATRTPSDRSGTTTGPGTPSDRSGTTTEPGTPTSGRPTPALGDLSVVAEQLATGFTSPVGIEVPQRGRRFVVDQPGPIYLQEGSGLRDEPFLDLSDRTVDVSGYSEQGVLGLAFHPEFDDNGRFFVRYSAPPRDGTPGGYSHTFVLSEFTADPEAATADPNSERTVLEIPEPQSNHNAGAIAFGPDGYLYVAVGDGGGANDVGNGHVSDWYEGNDGGNGQDVTENLLGSVLRIDVDGGPDDGGGEPTAAGDSVRDYAVPGDNPLVGGDGLDEHFAWGFRNPWRFSFGPDGRFFVADVGQNAHEEVSIVERGGNYGWNVREGTHCFGAENCPTESPAGRQLRSPVIEYPHSGATVSGISVIGGYLYGGDEMPDLRGLYVFADWQASGRLFAAREPDAGDGLWPTAPVSVQSDAQFGPNVLSFGRNPDGELLVCTTTEGAVVGSSGSVFRLRSA